MNNTKANLERFMKYLLAKDYVCNMGLMDSFNLTNILTRSEALRDTDKEFIHIVKISNMEYFILDTNLDTEIIGAVYYTINNTDTPGDEIINYMISYDDNRSDILNGEKYTYVDINEDYSKSDIYYELYNIMNYNGIYEVIIFDLSHNIKTLESIAIDNMNNSMMMGGYGSIPNMNNTHIKNYEEIVNYFSKKNSKLVNNDSIDIQNCIQNAVAEDISNKVNSKHNVSEAKHDNCKMTESKCDDDTNYL
ncbi:MAG: hypothetical protein ACRCXT_08085 [Paraclostridium sp.]